MRRATPPEQVQAHTLVNRAVHRGELVRPECCQSCGERASRIHGHHDDYSQPLAVVWLCSVCHTKVHRGEALTVQPVVSAPKLEQRPENALPVGSRVCQCAACLEYFSSPAAFDKHRSGDMDRRRCLTPDEMRAAGMLHNERGRWISSVNTRSFA